MTQQAVIETQASRPLAVGQSKGFPSGTGHTVVVIREAEDVWTVKVLGLNGIAVPGWTRTFDLACGDLQLDGRPAKAHANDFRLCALRDFAASTETPVQVASRVTVDRLTATDAARLSAAQKTLLRTAADGIVRCDTPAEQRTVRALYRLHLGQYVHRTDGMRSVLAGLRLNEQGQRLQQYLTSPVDLAA